METSIFEQALCLTYSSVAHGVGNNLREMPLSATGTSRACGSVCCPGRDCMCKAASSSSSRSRESTALLAAMSANLAIAS